MTRLRFSSSCPSLLWAERLQHGQQMWCKFAVSLRLHFTHTRTNTQTHTADSCSHGSSNSGWKQCTAPALMGSKEDYRLQLLCVVNHFLNLPFSLCSETGDIWTRPWQAPDERSLPTSKKRFVNMGSEMKPLAPEWTTLSIILNIRWQEAQNKGSSGASSVLAMWCSRFLLPRRLGTLRSTSQSWICPLQS